MSKFSEKLFVDNFIHREQRTKYLDSTFVDIEFQFITTPSMIATVPIGFPWGTVIS